jgi:hypothetical protein
LDIYGKISSENIKEKVVEIAKDKQADSPVIVILPSIKICEEYEALFGNDFVFGRGRVPE